MFLMQLQVLFVFRHVPAHVLQRHHAGTPCIVFNGSSVYTTLGVTMVVYLIKTLYLILPYLSQAFNVLEEDQRLVLQKWKGLSLRVDGSRLGTIKEHPRLCQLQIKETTEVSSLPCEHGCKRSSEKVGVYEEK